MEQQKIGFKDLNIWLKIPVVVIWVLTVLWILSFLIGMIMYTIE